MRQALWRWLGRGADTLQIWQALSIGAGVVAVVTYIGTLFSTMRWEYMTVLATIAVSVLIWGAVGAQTIYLRARQPGPIPSTTPQAATERDDVEREPIRAWFRTSAEDAAQHLETVLRHVCSQLRSRAGIIHSYCAELIEGLRVSNLSSARADMKRLVDDNISADMIRTTLDFYVHYQEAVMCMRDIGFASEFDWGKDGNYRLWKQLDAKMLADLLVLIGQSGYPRLRVGVRANRWPEGGIREYWA